MVKLCPGELLRSASKHQSKVSIKVLQQFLEVALVNMKNSVFYLAKSLACSQQTIACSKSTNRTLEKGVKYVQS